MNHYKTLRIDIGASPEVIKRAYRKLCSELHPDRNLDRDTTPEMQAVNAANAVLSDPEQRMSYDLAMGFAWRSIDDRLDALDAAIDAAVEAVIRRRRAQQEQPEPQEHPKPQPQYPDLPVRKPKPTRTAKAAHEPTKENPADDQRAERDALAAEVLKMCAVGPPESAGVMQVRAWKACAARYYEAAKSSHSTIEMLMAARKALMEVASPEWRR